MSDEDDCTDDGTEEASPQLVADAFGLVLKIRQFMAGNCTRADVLEFAYNKGLISDPKLADQVLEELLGDQP